MRMLMRNTVSKTATLASLFLCMLASAVVFSGITTSVHAITASEVKTEAELEQFVKEAVDEYYINTIIKACDFSDAPFAAAIAASGVDLATATVEEIKPLIPLFPVVGLTSRSDIAPYCDFSQRFDQVFGREDGDWKSDSIYLFVIDDTGTLLFHGDDPNLEGVVLVAEDEGGRDVADLIVSEAETPGNAGIIHYCWDDPSVNGDEIVDSNGDPIPGKAPGDSLKTSYVVDPFEYLGAPALSPSPGIVFGSGIYPKMDNRLPECDGDGMTGDGEEMEEMEEMEEPIEESMDEPGEMEMPTDTVDSVSGGGCAIASGGESAPQSTAFNLLLLSALFLAVSFRRRVTGKRNGVQS
ncbi:MAG: hypothetical protein OXK19_08440 [Candidatus Dadabacteria bacterium]|nr:hypothetical protein [Candidatus Dadabacteria bacterium]